jgi:flagellin-specific chaperone FliS
MFGLKLLAAAAERDGAVLTDMLPSQANGAEVPPLKQILASFYDLTRPNRLNRHTLNLVRILISRRAFAVTELRDFKILPNTNAMIYSMLENQQEQSLEIMLDILHELLSQLNDLVIPSEDTIVDHIDQIFNNFEPCIHLLNVQFDISLVEKASQCLIQILQLFAQSKLKRRDIYFTESHFPYLLSALKHSSHRPLIQKRMLKCVYWALIQNEYRIDLA